MQRPAEGVVPGEGPDPQPVVEVQERAQQGGVELLPPHALAAGRAHDPRVVGWIQQLAGARLGLEAARALRAHAVVGLEAEHVPEPPGPPLDGVQRGRVDGAPLLLDRQYPPEDQVEARRRTIEQM